MRRFSRKFTWIPVVLILAGFAWFAIRISDPPEKAERKDLVTGTILAADELKPDGPFIPYVALHAGEGSPAREVPATALDDRQPDGSGTFDLSADAGDGTRFYLLVRFETAKQERYCRVVPLPPVRQTADELWVEASTGEPLEPVRVAVDKSERCG